MVKLNKITSVFKVFDSGTHHNLYVFYNIGHILYALLVTRGNKKFTYPKFSVVWFFHFPWWHPPPLPSNRSVNGHSFIGMCKQQTSKCFLHLLTRFLTDSESRTIPSISIAPCRDLNGPQFPMQSCRS